MLTIRVDYALDLTSSQDVGIYAASWTTWIKTGSVVHLDRSKPFIFRIDALPNLTGNKTHARTPTLDDRLWFTIFESTLFSGDPDSSPVNNAIAHYIPGSDPSKDNKLFFQTNLCNFSISLKDIITGLLSVPGSLSVAFKKEIVDKKLMDYEKNPSKKIRDEGDYNRGFTTITVTVDSQTALKSIQSGILDKLPSKRVFCMSNYREVTTPFTQDYARTINEDCVTYTKEFFSIFPRFDDKTDTRKNGRLFYGKNGEFRLSASCDTLTTNHLPFFKTDYGRLPIMFYYLHKVRPTQVNQKHATFLESVASIVLERYGILINQFCSSVSSWLSGKVDNHNNAARQNFMTCMEIYCEVITEVANNVKYRPDFRLRIKREGSVDRYYEGDSRRKKSYGFGRTKEESVFMESVDWDLIVNFSGCDDCEGVDRLTAEIVHILENGIVGRNNYRRDFGQYPLLEALYHGALEDKKKIYGWNNVLLDCLQTISLHYIHFSTLVAAGTGSGGDFHETRLSMNNKTPVVGDEYKIGSEEDIRADYGCHMFSLAVPWSKSIEYIKRCFAVEDKEGVSRKEEAKSTVKLVEKIHHALTTRKLENYLPVLCVESTARVRPFFVSKVFDFDRIQFNDNRAIDEEIEDRYFDFVINNEDEDISRALDEESCTNYRVSALNWIPGESRKRHVSTFYRQCAYSFSTKLFELDPELGILAWIDTSNSKWGVPIPYIMRDEGKSMGLLCVHHRMSDIKNTMWRHMTNLSDMLPPVTIGNTEHAPSCKSLTYAEWIESVVNRFPSLRYHIKNGAHSERPSRRPNDGRLTLSNFKNFYVCDDYLSEQGASGLFKFFDGAISSGQFKYIDVYKQSIYPIFGKQETVIVLSK
jgi:hypothetical protein